MQLKDGTFRVFTVCRKINSLFPHTTQLENCKYISCIVSSKGKKVRVQADVVFGNDGAHSTVRREMMKCSLMDVRQIYVPYGYIELPVTKTKNNDVGYRSVTIGYLVVSLTFHLCGSTIHLLL